MARALRRRLQSYDISRRLRGRQPRKLRVFLDTIYERGAADFYEKNIFPALVRSRFLIVLATPDAVLRPEGDDWILREITDFRTHCDPDNVLVIRAAGEFKDELPGDLSQTLPNVQIIDLRGENSWWALSPLRATRIADEWLKLIAPLFDVEAREMPVLRREQERAQQTRIGVAFGLVIGALAFSVGVAAFAVSANFKATAAISDSLFAIGQLLRTTSDLPNDKRSAVAKSGMMVSACDLFDSLSGGKVPNGYVYERTLCDLDRARAFYRAGEKTRAQAMVDALRRAVNAEYEVTKSTDSVHAVRKVLNYDWAQAVAEKKEFTAANAALERNLERAIELRQAFPTDVSALNFATARAWTLIERAEEAKRYAEARRLLQLALKEVSATEAAVENDIAPRPDVLQPLGIRRALLLRRLCWLEVAYLEQPRRAAQSCETALRVLEAQAKRYPLKTGSAQELEHHRERMYAAEVLGVAHMKLNDGAAAKIAFGKAMQSIALLSGRKLRDDMAKDLQNQRTYIEARLADLRAVAQDATPSPNTDGQISDTGK